MSKSKKTKQDNTPWKGVEPYLLDLFDKSQGAVTPWTDEMKAETDWTKEATRANNQLLYDTNRQVSDNMLYNNTYTPQMDRVGYDKSGRVGYDRANTSQLSAGGLGAARQSQGNLDPTNQLSTILSGGQVNPYLQSMNQSNINDSLRGYQDSMDMMTQNMLPNIRSGAVAAGQYGGSRQGIAEGLVGQQAAKNARDLGISAMDSGNQLYGNAYQQMTNQQYDLANNLNNQAVGYEQFSKGLEQQNNENMMRETLLNNTSALNATQLNNQATQSNNQSALNATQLNNQSALDASNFGLGQALTGTAVLENATNMPMQNWQQQMGLLGAPNTWDWQQLQNYGGLLEPGLGFGSQVGKQGASQADNIKGGMQAAGSIGSMVMAVF